MSDETRLTRERLATLNRDQLVNMVKIHDAYDWQKRNPVSNKARDFCYNNVVGWNKRVLDVTNGILRAARRTNPIPTRDLFAAIASGENAVLAEMARGELSDKEFEMLTRPVYMVLAEGGSDDAAVASPEPASEPTKAPVASVPIEVVSEPQRPPEDVELDELFGTPEEGPSIPSELAIPEDVESTQEAVEMMAEDRYRVADDEDDLDLFLESA